jgi:hypothetical protein
MASARRGLDSAGQKAEVVESTLASFITEHLAAKHFLPFTGAL